MKLYFDDVAFDGQLQRSVGKSDSGMANVGECLAIAGQITPGDRDSCIGPGLVSPFRLFTKAEGAEGHCEGMAPIVFWDAAFNWLDSQLTS